MMMMDHVRQQQQHQQQQPLQLEELQLENARTEQMQLTPMENFGDGCYDQHVN